MSNIPVIAIDGPSGSGKGTIAVYIARQLKWHCLESGVIYRALSYAVKQQRISLENVADLVKAAEKLDIRFEAKPNEFAQHIWMNNIDVSDILRQESVGRDASEISRLPEVRGALLQRQRDFRQRPGLIAEGRDMGTVVFPDADLKIFLTASADVRAKRRLKQLNMTENYVTLQNLIADITVRDERDATRTISPLVPAQDAIILDTTHLTLEAVFEKVMQLILAVVPTADH